MSSVTDPLARDRWAHLRFSIIGPLMAAPAAKGGLIGALRILAAKTWRHPTTHMDVVFSVSTIERWYYAARASRDPVASLRNRLHGQLNRFPSMSAQVIEVLTAQYREHPGWTMQLHVDNLRAVLLGQDIVLPSYPTIRRYLRANGMFRQARPMRATAGALMARDRLERLEVRSFEVDHVSALWHLDFHHCSRKVLNRAGAWVKPMLLGIIDDRSRLVCHIQWYLDETAESLVHGLSQAFMKRGLPRALMTDNGAAMLADETVTGLARLGIVHQTTLPYSPYQNGKQEVLWSRVETRLMAMLEGETSLTLELLNEATQAWVEQEYHRTVHTEIGVTPLAHYLAGPNVRRECPETAALVAAFRIEVIRRQRRADGTVSLAGTRFEIPSRYRNFTDTHLRYARWDLSRVDLVDPRTGAILCPIRPLDKSANASGVRRALTPVGADLSALAPTGVATLLRQLIAEYAATGLPPAYLPTDASDHLAAHPPERPPSDQPTDPSHALDPT